MKLTVRTHDSFYINENRYKNPKQLHLGIIDLINNELEKNHKANSDADFVISDFGCAAGEFEYALKLAFPKAVIEGYELLPQLIEKANKEVAGVIFKQASVTDVNACPQAHSDFSLLVGVLGIFDSFEEVINNLIYWTKNGGTIFVHCLYNDFDIDVNIKYNYSNDYGTGVQESGWNIFSKKSLSNYLNSHAGVTDFEFIDFKMKIDLPRQEDVLRSWTFEDVEGNKIITNGLCLLQPHSILKINRA